LRLGGGITGLLLEANAAPGPGVIASTSAAPKKITDLDVIVTLQTIQSESKRRKISRPKLAAVAGSFQRPGEIFRRSGKLRSHG